MSTAAPGWSSFRARVVRPGVLAAVVRRDWAVTRSYRLAFLLDVFFGLLELVAYYFISRTFGDASPASLHGAPSYFAFAAVGAVLGAPIYAATAGVGFGLRQEQLRGTLEALMANPLRPAELCLGLTGFPFVFALARASLYLAVAAAWLHLDLGRTSWIGVLIVLIGTGVALSALGVLAGAVVLVFKRGEVVAKATVYGITLLSGSVFPISTLPGWLQPLSKVLPMRFAFDGIRSALFEGGGWGVDAAVLAAYGAVALPLSILVFSRAMRRALRVGTLAQY